MSEARIRVLHADDHALMRQGISSLLRALKDVEVVGEAENGRVALELIEADPPDVVLMDISMEGMNGLDATARITHQWPAVRVIILSMHTSEEHVAQALKAGATGYVLKDAGIGELELAIRAAMRGDSYLSPAVSKHIVKDYVRRVGKEADPLDQLTPRQREVLQLLAEGGTTQRIAHDLGISVKTVETHRARLMKNLNIYDVPTLVRFAMKTKLIGQD